MRVGGGRATWMLAYYLVCSIHLQQERHGHILEQRMQAKMQKQRKESSRQDTRASTKAKLSWHPTIICSFKNVTSFQFTWSQVVSWARISPKLVSAPTVVSLNRWLNWSNAFSNLFPTSCLSPSLQNIFCQIINPHRVYIYISCYSQKVLISWEETISSWHRATCVADDSGWGRSKQMFGVDNINV